LTLILQKLISSLRDINRLLASFKLKRGTANNNVQMEIIDMLCGG